MQQADYLAELNGPQREAVLNYTGPTLIIAGAGSGKTRVLTMRIAHMLAEGVLPRQILALTFTNKAAREMRERVNRILPHEAVRGLWMGTFHSIFSRILRAEASLLGFPEAFTIYDTADSRNVVKHIIRQLELPDDTYKPNGVYARISLAKNNLVLPEAYAANATLTEEDARSKQPRIAEIYARYTQQCRQNGAMDFDDLLLYMNILLRDHPEVAEKYGQLFRYILVDEYQDTNYSQYLIVKRLADIGRNICVVGDDSQSIYSFRGARIENILRFQQDYPDAQIFKLEQNYRSTRTIVEAANSVIEKNSRKLPKKLFSENESGDPIRVFCALSDKEEARQVSSDLHTTLYSQQASPADFAILYRTNAQSRILEEYLRNKNIPYRIYGGHSFYQRAEIKDAIAYLRLAINPRDDESLRRIINFPARSIGETSLQKIAAAAQARSISMWETLLTTPPDALEIRGPAVKSITAFVNNFSELFAKAPQTDAYELATEVMNRSGLARHYKESKSIEDESRLQNVEELMNSIHGFVEERQQVSGQAETEEEGVIDPQTDGPVTLDRWLQEIALLTDQDENKEDDTPKVTLLTVHAAKGLEFKHTYIVGLEENLFPSQHGNNPSAEDLEEERRLFYVALTRAEKRATLSFALSRFKWGTVVPSQPSRFIKEIDAQYLELPPMPESSAWSADDDEREGDPRPAFRRFQQRKTSTPSASGAKPAAVNPLIPPVGFKKVGTRTSSGRTGSMGGAERTSGIAGHSAPTSPATSATLAEGRPLQSAGELTVGAQVVHARFGVGTVEAFEQTATDTKITVRFDRAGTKTLLLKFAKLQLLD